MNDIEYLLKQDIREKKSIGRGIYAKKNGCKSKKCTLPSDYMTNKEKKKMNSEVESYSLKKFYSYEEFKTLPLSIQCDYLNRLMNKYEIGLCNIAKEQFQISSNGLRTHTVKNGYFEKLSSRLRGWRTSKEALDVYRRDLLTAVKSENADKNSAQTETALDEKQNYICPLAAASITTLGFDQEVFDWLTMKYKGRNVHVTISVEA